MDPSPRPLLAGDLGGKVVYCLLRPEASGAGVLEGIDRARRLGLAGVAVRPCDIEIAVRRLEGSGVRAGSVVAFPHGSATTAAKLFEARDLLRRGAKEIGIAVGTARLVTREFQHLQTELAQIVDACHKEGARATAILESGWLTDELKIIALRCLERAEVDAVSASSGYGPCYAMADLQAMRKYLPEETEVEARVESLAQALEAYHAGASRFLTANPEAILQEWERRAAPTG